MGGVSGLFSIGICAAQEKFNTLNVNNAEVEKAVLGLKIGVLTRDLGMQDKSF
jgi:hypothetical protein